MREIDKSIQKKTQLKTTTIFLTLLIAVALLLSSTVTAITPRENEKENIVTIPTSSVSSVKEAVESLTMISDTVENPGTEPLEAPGDILWTMDVEGITGDIRLLGVEITPDEHIWLTGASDYTATYLYELAKDGTLLNQWPQAPHSTGWGWRDLCYNTLDGYLYASVNYNIDQIDPATGTWTGVSYPGPISPCRALAHDPATDHYWTASFSTNFYEFDSSGTIYNSFINPWGGAYGMAWDDICGLPSLWVHDQYGSGTDMHEVDPITGLPTGTIYQYTQGIAGGACFVDMDGFGQLVGLTQGTPDELFSIEICQTVPLTHDVGATAIVTPTAGAAFCPCTDVEVTVTNFAISDEVDVPVTVEIRRDVYVDDFTLSYGVFWDPIYLGNTFFQSAGEMAYPFIVAPRSPPFMIELDSGLTGPGQAYLDSLAFDATEFCHPAMSFWMWHDEYGSDDFLNVFVNDGSGWIQVGGPYYRLCCPDCPTGWMEHKIDLSTYAGGLIWVRFEGNCDSNPGAYDLQIDDFTFYDQEYKETVYVDIDVGEVKNVELPQWCPCWWQVPSKANTYFNVDVIACTELDIDEKASNDCRIETVTMYMPFEHDIAAISIDEPVGRVPVQTFDMCGTIKNVGQYEECCFSVYMTVEEQYIIPGIPPTPDTILFNEDFSTWLPGWTIIGGWLQSPYAQAGGTAPEAELYWIDSYGYDVLTSPAVNTIGASGLELEFKSLVDYYTAGTTWCTVEVTDGIGGFVDVTPWPNPIMSNQGPATYTIDISSFIGPGTQVQFVFSGPYYDLDWWDIDDVKFIEPGDPGTPDTYGYYAPEYEEQFCVDEIDICEEMQICFDDWTPGGTYPDCGSKTYRICLETRMCDPMDENPANNMHCELVTVDFWHDVAFKEFTSPAFDRAGTLLYDSGDTDGSNGLSLLGSPKREILDDFVITSDATVKEISLYLLWNTLPPGSGTGFEVNFLADNAGTPGAIIASPTTTSYSEVATGRVWFSRQEVEITAQFNGVALAAGTYWVKGWTTATAPENAFWMAQSPPNIDGSECWVDYSDLGGLMTSTAQFGAPYGVSFRLYGDEGSIAPEPDLYIPCGQQELCANVENLGTYDEPGTNVNWELYEYMSDYPMPTFVDGGSVVVDLDAGEVEEVCFVTYNFVDAGIYSLHVDVVAPGTDCYPDNNEGVLVIGVDCCPPESEHTLDPATPDGENNWYVSDVEVTITAEDLLCPDPCEAGVETGISEIIYTVNGVEHSIPGASGSFILDEDGNNLVTYYAIDGVGNEEVAHTFTVAIDQTKPSCDLAHTEYEGATGWMVDFEAIAADVTSGMNRVEFKRGTELLDTITTPPYEYTHTWESGDGSKTFYAYAYDQAGNSASDSASIQLSMNLVLQQGKVLNVNKVLQKLI